MTNLDAARAALEAAAKVCDSVNNYDNPMTAADCAAAIRAIDPAEVVKPRECVAKMP